MKANNQISTFNPRALIAINPEFKKLLILISLVNVNDIPYELLINNQDKIIVDSFVRELLNYSLISTKFFSKSGDISDFSFNHSNIQGDIFNYLITEDGLNSDDYLLKSVLSDLINYIKRVIDEENHRIMKLVLVHYEAILEHKSLLSGSTLVTLKGAVGEIYHYLGNYEKSSLILNEVIVQLEKTETNNSAEKAKCHYYLGEINRSLAKYEIAENNFNTSLNIYREYFPDSHKEIAQNLSNFGNMYRAMGNYENAKILLQQAHLLYKTYLTSDYCNIFWILLFLGYTEEGLGHYQAAKSYFDNSLLICTEHMMQDLVKQAWALANIGNMVRIFGDYGKAKEYINLSLALSSAVLPETHKGVITTKVYLGEIESELGNDNKASKIFEEALLHFRKNLEEDTLPISWTKSLLAVVKGKQGNFEQAKALLNESLNCYKKICGETNLKMADIFNKLGQVYLFEECFEKAEKFFIKSLAILQKNNHSDSYFSLENLARIYVKKSSCAVNNAWEANSFKKQATQYLIQAQEIMMENYSKDSPHYARIGEKIASINYMGY